MPQHMCGSFIFVPSELKVEQMTTLMEVKKKPETEKETPFLWSPRHDCPRCELQWFWIIFIQDVRGRLIIWLAGERVEERQEGVFPSTSDE